jgi:hypothetical protein
VTLKGRREVSLVPVERVESRILVVRGHRVLLDSALAEMYGVSTKVLLQSVRRNEERFPEDFMFELDEQEVALLAQNAILSRQEGRGGRRYRPYAFTEQGVAMLSSVLRSPRAVRVNIEIMRAFVNLRKLLASHADLARRIDELEAKYDENFKAVFDAIRMLMAEPEPEEPRKTPIGFRAPDRPRIEPKPNARRRPALAR